MPHSRINGKLFYFDYNEKMEVNLPKDRIITILYSDNNKQWWWTDSKNNPFYIAENMIAEEYSSDVFKYGLREKKSGQFLCASITATDGDDCNETMTELVVSLGGPWLVKFDWHAEWVRHNSTDWYNTTSDTPKHGFKADDLEVVKFQLVEESCKVTLPKMVEPNDFYELCDFKRAEYHDS